MTDGSKEWVTLKVPEDDRDTTRQYIEDINERDDVRSEITYGDCLVAGAERLDDAADSDDLGYLDVGVAPDRFAELVASSVADELSIREGVDAEDIAERVAAHIDTDGATIDYAELSNRVADELEGRMR